MTTISVTIDKIGLKDAQTYLKAFLSVSLVAASGALLETQDTPEAHNLKPNYVLFNNTVHIQTSLEDIVSRGEQQRGATASTQRQAEDGQRGMHKLAGAARMEKQGVVHSLTWPCCGFSFSDLCLFFEFKHYKPSKKKTSTRCFALLEAKELQKAISAAGGPVCLELYKKPTDFSRRALHLFTIKQLYLHCTVNAIKH